MKKIVLSLALVSASFAFAQKKEIQNASKAIEKNDGDVEICHWHLDEAKLQAHLQSHLQARP